MQTLSILGEQIVVHDHPARIGLRSICHAQYLDLGLGIDHPDFAPPVELERGGADNEDHPGRCRDLHADDGLAGFAEPHVVAENRPAFGDQE